MSAIIAFLLLFFFYCGQSWFKCVLPWFWLHTATPPPLFSCLFSSFLTSLSNFLSLPTFAPLNFTLMCVSQIRSKSSTSVPFFMKAALRQFCHDYDSKISQSLAHSHGGWKKKSPSSVLFMDAVANQELTKHQPLINLVKWNRVFRKTKQQWSGCETTMLGILRSGQSRHYKNMTQNNKHERAKRVLLLQRHRHMVGKSARCVPFGWSRQRTWP